MTTNNLVTTIAYSSDKDAVCSTVPQATASKTWPRKVQFHGLHLINFHCAQGAMIYIRVKVHLCGKQTLI